MKMNTHILNIMLAMVFLFFVSCAGEELEGPTGVKLTLKARTMLKSATDTVKINEALIGVSKLDFRPEGNEAKSEPDKIVYNGPYVVDLLNGNTNPEIKWVFVDPGVYREVKISSTGILSGGHSIIVRGTIKNAGNNKEVPFEFSTETDQEIYVRSTQGILVKEGDITELMIIFELAGLFNGVDLASIDRNSQGILMFTDETGSGIVAGLKERLENLSSFGLFDSNFDGTQVETAGPGNGGDTGGSTGSGGGTGSNDDQDGNTPGSGSGQDDGGAGGTTDPGSGSGNDEDDSDGSDSDPGDGDSGGNDDKDDDQDNDQGSDPGAGSGPDEDDDDKDDDSGDNSGQDDDNPDGGSGNDNSNDTDDDNNNSGDDTGIDYDDGEDDGEQDDDDDDKGKDDSDKDNSGKGNSGDGNSGKDDNDKGNSGNKGGNDTADVPDGEGEEGTGGELAENTGGNTSGDSGKGGNSDKGNSGDAPGNSGNSGNGNKGGNSGNGK